MKNLARRAVPMASEAAVLESGCEHSRSLQRPLRMIHNHLFRKEQQAWQMQQ
jgi:hypothetical protein